MTNTSELRGLVADDDYAPPGKILVQERQGWHKASLNEMFDSTPHLRDVQYEFQRTLKDWIVHMKDDWWRGINHYDKITMIRHGVLMRELVDEKGQTNLMRKVTAASLIFDFEVPKALFCLDEVVVDWTLRYLVATEPQRIDLDTIPKFDEYVHVPDFSSTVKVFMTNQHLLAAIFDSKRPPNIVHMRENLGYPMNLSSQLTVVQLRKILSAIYLSAGLAIPTDYIYVDMDVHDFVKKVGNFEVQFKEKAL